jgi:hypothetical protein
MLMAQFPILCVEQRSQATNTNHHVFAHDEIMWLQSLQCRLVKLNADNSTGGQSEISRKKIQLALFHHLTMQHSMYN